MFVVSIQDSIKYKSLELSKNNYVDNIHNKFIISVIIIRMISK